MWIMAFCENKVDVRDCQGKIASAMDNSDGLVRKNRAMATKVREPGKRL